MNRKLLLVILVAFSTAYFAGCSSNPKHLSITISTPPPASIVPGGSVQIAATETGTTAPIDWTCTPGSGYLWIVLAHTYNQRSEHYVHSASDRCGTGDYYCHVRS